MNTKLKNTFLNISTGVQNVVNSSIFPYLTAVLALVCYYAGLDLLLMYYLAISVVLIFLFCDDVTPAVCSFLFLGIMISKQNSPSTSLNSSDFYHKTSTLIQIVILAVFIAVSLALNFIRNVKSGRMKITPTFWGLAALAVTFIINGVFSEGYKIKNMPFGIVMAAFWFVVYCFMFAGIRSGSEGFQRVSGYFAPFGIVLIIELTVAYLTADGIFEGGFHRGMLTFGWGVYNTMGMWLVISIPPVMYLASKHTRGYLFLILGIALLAASMASGSRQAMVFAPVAFFPCLILLLIRGRNKKPNLIITGVTLLICLVFAVIFFDKLTALIKDLFSNFVVNGKPNGSGRWKIWTVGVEHFLSAPVFGVGFYVNLPYESHIGLSFFPMMYHDTFIQIVASCGMVGLFAYIVHRAQTVISYLKNPSYERTYIALTLMALLLVNLVDNHLFNIYPTLIYSSLIAMLIRSENEISK